jgi:hypothetical protein
MNILQEMAYSQNGHSNSQYGFIKYTTLKPTRELLKEFYYYPLPYKPSEEKQLEVLDSILNCIHAIVEIGKRLERFDRQERGLI